MRAKFQTPSNHIDNFQSIAFRKISQHRRMSLVNNRFSNKIQNLRSRGGKQGTSTTSSMEAGKRVSLITGKQMTFTPTTRRSRHYRRIQLMIYNYLERPTGFYAVFYQIIIFATVFLCLILSVLATIHQYENIASNALMYTEIVIVFWLSIELSLRVWSAGCRSRYQTWRGRLKFMKNVFCILDLTVIVASISLTVIATSQNKHKNFAAAAFRGLRFFQILRMLRVDRRAGTWRLLGTVVWAHRQELITTFYIGFLSLIISSFVMYLIEKDDEDSKIKTFADSLWWGVITLCTIGYGDVVPRTWGGKLLASSCALIGISFFALPAGILGSGFALKVQAMQRQKHLNRRRAPAATLIQCLWRCYAADPNSMSLATWKPATKAIVHAAAVAAAAHPPVVPSLSQQPVIPEYSIANIARPYIGPNSFLNRVTSLKRRMPQSTASTGGHGSSQHHPHHHINSELRHHHHQVIVPKIINENKSYIKTNSLIQLPPRDANSTPEMLASSLQSRRDAIVIPSQLFNAQTSIYSPYAPPPTQANVVTAPVASVTNGSTGGGSVGDNNPNCPSPGPDPLILADLADPPSLNNSYVMALQQVSRNRQQESSKITPVKSSLAHRTLNFLTDFNASNLLARQSDPESGDPAHQGEPNTPHGTTSSSHGKPQLTLQQKNAIRALRKIKYFVARRKFREALRPYDVTDVIEQYSAGNLDMLARIKTLQFRLDKILGSTKSKECYDSNTTSLASRIVKVERQMDDVSIKLEKFFASYTLDMKLLMEKTTENCILNETYLKYGDDVFRKEDILPTEITPSMIYHKKSVKLTPNSDLVATSGSPFATSSRQGSLFRSPRSNNNKTVLDGVEVITADDDSLKLRALKEEKLQIEERIRYTLEQIKHKKAAVKSRFLFDILDDDGDDDGGSYDYDDSSNNAATLAVKSCVSSLRNESLSSAQQQVEAAAREKSRSDGLIRLVDRRRRKNKYFMRKYFINALKYKISVSQLPDSSTARLKKFKSDNDVWFDEELSRHYVMRNLMLSNMCSDDDVIVIKSSRDRYAQLKLAAAATASAATSNTSNRNKEEPKKFVFEYDEMSKLLTSCNDDEKQGVETLNTCLTPCSVDPSLTSTCLIDLPDNVSQSQSLSTRGETQSQQQKKEPPPPLRPMTTGYFSLHFDQPPSSGEPENNSDIKSPSSESQ